MIIMLYKREFLLYEPCQVDVMSKLDAPSDPLFHGYKLLKLTELS